MDEILGVRVALIQCQSVCSRYSPSASRELLVVASEKVE